MPRRDGADRSHRMRSREKECHERKAQAVDVPSHARSRCSPGCWSPRSPPGGCSCSSARRRTAAAGRGSHARHLRALVPSLLRRPPIRRRCARCSPTPEPARTSSSRFLPCSVTSAGCTSTPGCSPSPTRTERTSRLRVPASHLARGRRRAHRVGPTSARGRDRKPRSSWPGATAAASKTAPPRSGGRTSAASWPTRSPATTTSRASSCGGARIATGDSVVAHARRRHARPSVRRLLA
jgi:hypothetical protein